MKSMIQKRYFLFLLVIGSTLIFSSCKKDNNDKKEKTPVDEVAGYNKIQEFTQGDYTFFLYKKDTGNLKTGYDEVYIQLKNNTTGKYVENASLSWKPVMHMGDMSHGTPYSSITKVSGTSTLYKGYFVFVMASEGTDFWEITYYYTIGNDTIVNVSDKLTVEQSSLIKEVTFKGSDSSRYVLALIKPSSPVVGKNEITAYLFKASTDFFTFTSVENYTIQIDPRMPDMNNHTSPNNVNLVYNSGIYSGSVNLTMTGYWKINLVVVDANNTMIKGETVTEAHTASSLYVEIEF